MSALSSNVYKDPSPFERFIASKWPRLSTSLLHLLQACAFFNPKTGYCQGMDQLALFFLLFMTEEVKHCSIRSNSKEHILDCHHIVF